MKDEAKAVLAAFGGELRAQRRRRGLTLAELAERAGIDPGFLAYIESGKRSPSLRTAARLARALGVPVSELFAPPRRRESDRCAAVDREARALTRRCKPAQVPHLVAVLRALRDPAVLRAIRTLVGAAPAA